MVEQNRDPSRGIVGREIKSRISAYRESDAGNIGKGMISGKGKSDAGNIGKGLISGEGVISGRSLISAQMRLSNFATEILLK